MGFSNLRFRNPCFYIDEVQFLILFAKQELSEKIRRVSSSLDTFASVGTLRGIRLKFFPCLKLQQGALTRFSNLRFRKAVLTKVKRLWICAFMDSSNPYIDLTTTTHTHNHYRLTFFNFQKVTQKIVLRFLFVPSYASQGMLAKRNERSEPSLHRSNLKRVKIEIWLFGS